MAPHPSRNRRPTRVHKLSRQEPIARLLAIFFMFVAAGFGFGVRPAAAQDESQAGAVVAVPISGVTDLGLAPFLARALDEAGDISFGRESVDPARRLRRSDAQTTESCQPRSAL